MTGKQQLWLIGLGAFVILGGVLGYLLWPQPAPVVIAPVVVVEPEPEPEPTMTETVIGQSVEGRAISAVTFGNGATHLLFVGGMHGGYEWNSSLLAYDMIDHFTANLDLIPETVTISIIPDLNPDGTALVTGGGRFEASAITDPANRVAAGRFNANNVDLNRNFDCKWAPESTWRGTTVNAGTGPFSEPEAAALRDHVSNINPTAVVFWHSQANNVYASECEDGVLPETLTLMNAYATAGAYGAVPSFDAYPITGDAEGWLASIGIPAITVELKSFRSIEWDRNLAGVNAILDLYQTAQ